MVLLFLLFALSTPWAIRLTGYKFFPKSHYVLAMIYIGACIGHWGKLSCYLVPAVSESIVRPGSDRTPDSSSATSTSVAYPCYGPPSDPFSIQKTAIPASNPRDLPIHRHPDLSVLVKEFIYETICSRTTVYASGPGRMISDFSSIVSKANDGSKVRKSDERYDVSLVCDDRLEWRILSMCQGL